jgi:hypothetical protein
MRSSDVLIELWELLERVGVEAGHLHGRTRVEDLGLDEGIRQSLSHELAQRLGCSLGAELFELPTLNDVIDTIVRIGQQQPPGSSAAPP